MGNCFSGDKGPMPSEKKATKKRIRVNKLLIGNPSNFKHLVHHGADGMIMTPGTTRSQLVSIKKDMDEFAKILDGMDLTPISTEDLSSGQYGATGSTKPRLPIDMASDPLPEETLDEHNSSDLASFLNLSPPLDHPDTSTSGEFTNQSEVQNLINKPILEEPNSLINPQHDQIKAEEHLNGKNKLTNYAFKTETPTDNAFVTKVEEFEASDLLKLVDPSIKPISVDCEPTQSSAPIITLDSSSAQISSTADHN